MLPLLASVLTACSVPQASSSARDAGPASASMMAFSLRLVGMMQISV